ncbi:hypothetical protein Rhopal_007800-T1 [Rhodotorula paludigena]|uniref:phosphoribosylglycinamide formyltransferase 1 n=1 Tax=Rhodotorula paludigena TaxID=86838 RepID=A0AAV5GXM9_9BASI|nr:hypothetical protein Rhopal_007800-T1 [Rhodotorula paludigena]
MAQSPRKWRITVLISGSGKSPLARISLLVPIAVPRSNLQALLDATQRPPSDPLSLAHCAITAVVSSRSDARGLVRARTFAPAPTPAEAFPLLRWRKLAGNADRTRTDWERDLARKIRETRPDVVVLAGWMLILGPEFLSALSRDWDEPPSSSSSSEPAISSPCVDPTSSRVGAGLSTPGPSPYSPSLQPTLRGRPIPIINLHPALPGQFPGAHAIRDAWEAFNTPPASAFSSATGTADVLTTVGGEAPEAAGRRIEKTGIMVHRVIPLLDAGEPVVVKDVPLVEGESLDDLEERVHAVEHVGIVEAVREVVRLVEDGTWWDAEEAGRQGAQ